MQVNGVEYSCHRANASVDGMLMLFSGLFRVGALPDIDDPFSEMGSLHDAARLYNVALSHRYWPQHQCLPARRKPLRLK
jgi:hypothetical protein